jgi:3-oxoacyl-[acyl-carrier protein] reductase
MAGKVAWITGSGRGLGQAHAILLAERAPILSCMMFSSTRLGHGRQIKALGRRVFLSPPTSRTRSDACLAAEASRALGKIDILVNNAGIGQHRSMKRSRWKTSIGCSPFM